MVEWDDNANLAHPAVGCLRKIRLALMRSPRLWPAASTKGRVPAARRRRAGYGTRRRASAVMTGNARFWLYRARSSGFNSIRTLISCGK